MALGRVLVCIPTFNERENLPLIVRRVRTAVPDAELLIVDDNSPDGTGKVADELAYADPAVQVLHRTDKAGLGAAYVAAFRWGLDHGVDVLVEMDADGSHQPEQLRRLLEALEAGADVALGSRYVPGGEVEDWPRRRLLLSRGGNTYTRLLLGLPLADATGGYRAYRAAALKDIGFESVQSQGYCFQVDLVWRAWQRGLKVQEVPITFRERQVGSSKMSRNIVGEALWRVTVWGIRSRRGKRPLS